jgi:hypothetical protein
VRSRGTRGVMALTAVLVLFWSNVALAGNGDPLTAGADTTATRQTSLTTTQSSGSGLFVTLDGTSTGSAIRGRTAGAGNGVLGASAAGSGVKATTGSASQAALAAQNTGGGPAASFTVTNGPPFTVSSSAVVTDLNADRVDGRNASFFLPATGKAADADKLDGHDSSDFLPNTVPLSLTGATSSDGVIAGTNTGSANGVQGISDGDGSSGVYGQSNGAGFGVAGRANAPGGVGVYAESTGGGPALRIHTNGAPPMQVDSSAKVDNLNADKVDGASILSNRIISTTQNAHILQLPGFGDFNVVSCDHTNAVFQWSSGGPVAFVFWWDEFNTSDSFEGVANIVTSNPRPHHFVTVQLARDVGANTSMATVTLTTRAADCVFAAQAIVQPG